MKAKKQTGRRKADAAVVSDGDVRAFADGVERVVDGWRCVDVDAFAREVERRGDGEGQILEFVKYLSHGVSWFADALMRSAEHSKNMIQAWKDPRIREFNKAHREFKFAQSLQEDLYNTGYGALDEISRVPMMIDNHGCVRLLNLDAIVKGAGVANAVRLYGCIAGWCASFEDLLRSVSDAYRYDRLSAAVEGAACALDVLPDMLHDGFVKPLADVLKHIEHIKGCLREVRKEVAAAETAQGAKGGAAIWADGSRGAKRQGGKVGRRRDRSPETMELRNSLIAAWNDYKPKTGQRTKARFINNLEEDGSCLIDGLDKAANDEEKEKGHGSLTLTRIETAKRLIGNVQRRN